MDIRVFIIAREIPAYSILIFMEACYQVDKVFRGLGKTALELVKRWHIPQDMAAAYMYILSDERFFGGNKSSVNFITKSFRKGQIRSLCAIMLRSGTYCTNRVLQWAAEVDWTEANPESRRKEMIRSLIDKYKKESDLVSLRLKIYPPSIQSCWK